MLKAAPGGAPAVGGPRTQGLAPLAAAPPVGGTRPMVSPPRLGRAEPAGKGSFEMRLGTYWLVRIGIVMVLTALVFFGNLAYTVCIYWIFRGKVKLDRMSY